MTSLSPKDVAVRSWLAHLDSKQLQRFKDIFEIRKIPYGQDSPQVLSLTQRGVVERDISTNEGQLAESYDNYQKVAPGDFVLNPMDLLSGWVARSQFEGVVSNAYFVFNLKEKSLRDGENPRFYEHVLQSYYKGGILEPFGKGVGRPENSGGRWTINAETLGTIVFPKFSPSTQDAIVEFLDRELFELDNLLEKFRTLQSLASERIQASISRSTNSDNLPAHSGDWQIRKLGHLFRLIGSGTTPTSGDESYFGGETPWVTTGELRENLIYETDKSVSAKALEEYSALRVFPKGSLVMALYGATIGRIAFLGVDATVNQACCVMAEPNGVDPRFVYYALQGSKPRLLSLAVGGGQPNISQEIVRQFRIAIPSLIDQRRIVEELDLKVGLATRLAQGSNQTVGSLLERRNSLIFSVVTGKVNVRGS